MAKEECFVMQAWSPTNSAPPCPLLALGHFLKRQSVQVTIERYKKNPKKITVQVGRLLPSTIKQTVHKEMEG